MNIYKFEELLKEINPRFRIRQRGASNICGIFIGDKDFKATISRGHIPLNTYRFIIPNGDDRKEKIIKRGRAEALRMLKSRNLLSNFDTIRIKYGIAKS